MKRQKRKPASVLNAPVKRQVEQVTKRDQAPEKNPFVTFSEWSSEADEKAYAEL